MNLDFLVFPTPDSSYNHKNSSSELIFIPRLKENCIEENKVEISIKIPEKSEISKVKDISNAIPITNNVVSHIPCLFLKASSSHTNHKFSIFFHGNAEDINLSYEILNHIRYTLNSNVIAPEYPGYGIYPGRPSQEGIYEDSVILFDFLVEKLKVPESNILIFGRSLGTSPSTYLASRRQVGGLILISPMLSIRKVVSDILGKFVSYFMNDRFENYKLISQVKSPILLIHGQNDKLISYSHSTELYNLARAPCELILPENMDHNEFDFFQEFSEPLIDFITRNGIFSHSVSFDLEIDKSLFIAPEQLKQPFKQWNMLTKLLKKLSLN